MNSDDLHFGLPTLEGLFGGYSMTDDKDYCHNVFTDYCNNFVRMYYVMTNDLNYFGDNCRCVNKYEEKSYYELDDKAICIRPIIPFSQIAKYSKVVANDVNKDGIDSRLKKDYFEVTFGEYPVKRIKNKESEILEANLTNTDMIYTNKNYIQGTGKDAKCFKQYYYKGRKFIRVDEYEWFEVLKVVWQVDLKKDIAISKYVLFGGVSYNNSKKYLKDIFAKDIIPSNYPLIEENNLDKKYINEDINKIYNYYKELNNKRNILLIIATIAFLLPFLVMFPLLPHPFTAILCFIAGIVNISPLYLSNN